MSLEADCQKAKELLDLKQITLGAEEKTRYGSKRVAQLLFGEEVNSGILISINSRRGTGNATVVGGESFSPQYAGGLQRADLVMRPHSQDAHEWVAPLQHPKHAFLHRVSLSHSGEAVQEDVSLEACFTSHRTRFHSRTELFSNPKDPSGIAYPVHNMHALYNPNAQPVVLLVVTAPKGIPLTSFQQDLIARTGGVHSYLLNIDLKTGGRLPDHYSRETV